MVSIKSESVVYRFAYSTYRNYENEPEALYFRFICK